MHRLVWKGSLMQKECSHRGSVRPKQMHSQVLTPPFSICQCSDSTFDSIPTPSSAQAPLSVARPLWHRGSSSLRRVLTVGARLGPGDRLCSPYRPGGRLPRPLSLETAAGAVRGGHLVSPFRIRIALWMLPCAERVEARLDSTEASVERRFFLSISFELRPTRHGPSSQPQRAMV